MIYVLQELKRITSFPVSLLVMIGLSAVFEVSYADCVCGDDKDLGSEYCAMYETSGESFRKLESKPVEDAGQDFIGKGCSYEACDKIFRYKYQSQPVCQNFAGIVKLNEQNELVSPSPVLPNTPWEKPISMDDCASVGEGFDTYLSDIDWDQVGGAWNGWSDPRSAGTGSYHESPDPNRRVSVIRIHATGNHNNCNTPPGDWPYNNAGAVILKLDDLPDLAPHQRYQIRLGVYFTIERTANFLPKDPDSTDKGPQPTAYVTYFTDSQKKRVEKVWSMSQSQQTLQYYRSFCIRFKAKPDVRRWILADPIMSFRGADSKREDIFMKVRSELAIRGIRVLNSNLSPLPESHPEIVHQDESTGLTIFASPLRR